MLRDLLRAEGFAVGRKHVTTLMRRLGLTALYRKPNTSKRAPGHTIWPYLLRTLQIARANHVWAMDITYIPMARGFVYLAAVIDWHSRKVRKRGLKALLTVELLGAYSKSLSPSLTSSMNTSFDQARPMALSRRFNKALRLSSSRRTSMARQLLPSAAVAAHS